MEPVIGSAIGLCAIFGLRSVFIGRGGNGGSIQPVQIALIPRNKYVPLYAALVRNIMQFFQTKQAPVPLSETLEIMAFIEAANKSAATNGRPVELNAEL